MILTTTTRRHHYRRRRSNPNFRALVVVPLALLTALTLLASCGSSAESDDASGGGDSETTTTAAPTTASTAAPTTAATSASDTAGAAVEPVVAFTDCMSNSGVELPELEVDDDGLLPIGQVLTAIDFRDTSTQLAMFGCQGQLDTATGGGLAQLLESQELQDALTDYSACVREGGYVVPDLTVTAIISGALGGGLGGANGSTSGFLADALGLDATDPAVIATVDSCAADIEERLGDLGLG
ncbi:MAG: hypothetical protein ACRBK7_05640 [Acidimicrobiales bacterium]